MKKEYIEDNKEKELIDGEVDKFVDELRSASPLLKKKEVDELINLVKGVYVEEDDNPNEVENEKEIE